MSRVSRRAVVLAVGMVLSVATAATAGGYEVVKAGPLMSLQDSAQNISPGNFQLNLTLENAVPKGEKDAADVTATITCAGGKWMEGTAHARGWNQAKHSVDASGLKVGKEKVSGTIVFTLKPDRWVPADKKPRTLTVQIEGKVSEIKAKPDDEEKPIRFWLIKPRSQGASLKLTGTFTSKMGDMSSRGDAQGTFQLPVRPGYWNMGLYKDGGLQLHFNMGSRRENWNHVRLAVCEFEKTRNLADHSGIRLGISTAKPRKDVSVTVWLQEEDGSWYYVRSAVPLVSKKNAATLRFRDFIEAEWVAPGNHMDEDYVLDTSRLRAIAIGVVNPLGVGEVDFALDSLEWVDCPPMLTEPAEAVVSGRTLSVNGHEMIPAPMFGGYAPDLAQKYRPGTQRYLYAPSYPRIPGQIRAKLSRSDVKDWGGLVAKISSDSDPLAKHLRGLLGDRSKNRLSGLVRRKGRGNAPKDLPRVLNDLLRDPKLYHAEAWKGVNLPAELKKLAEKSADMGVTRRMQVNRRLMAAAFEKHIEPMPQSGPTEEYYIECYGERGQPAQLLTSSNWKDALTNWGRTYAGNAKANEFPAVLEFWNEPYLNWAERSRVNYNLKFYDLSKAKEGGAVHTKYGLKVPHLSWRKKGGKWQVYDPTAFSYWSGRGNSWIYDQMLAAIGKGVKETYPAVRVIGGWGFRYNEDHWAAWDMLYKPTIDRNIDVIDGIHEHHYQGDTTTLNGTYEVLIAYSRTKYDRWLHSYNTETNDLVDAPARGAVDTPEEAKRSREYRRMTYNLRDCLYCCYATPDKTASRTVIHNDHTPQATEIAYGLMKNLRGRLVETRTTDPDVWVLSSIDGTDPNAMLRDGGQTMVVFVFNNHRRQREVKLRVAAPEGTTFASAIGTQVLVDKDTWKMKVVDGKVKTDGTSAEVALRLPERSVYKLEMPLKGSCPDRPQVVRKQYFSPTILQEVAPDKPLKMSVKVDPAPRKKARRAWLRLVVELIAEGEASVTVGGETLAIPAAYTGDNQTRIVEIPLKLEQLADETELTFSVNEGNYAGYRVDMASVYLETAE